MANELTPTSYAILGLLALKPWTTYELAQQMDRALGQFWPRARSKIFEEPKKLERLGLAKAKAGTTGSRPRTVYSITTKGRRALGDWVPQPGAGPRLEFESLIKVFFAEHGSRDDLLATLRSLDEWRFENEQPAAGISESYLEGRGQFQHRLALNILVGKFLGDFNEMVANWSAWAIGIVETWPEDVTAAPPDMDVLRTMADRSAAYLAARAAPGATS